MTWASWGAFVVAMTALCVVPGPAVLLVLSQALSHGTAKAVWSILGIIVAGTAWFVLSATGIGAVLTASYELFFAIKWIGVAYLVWLGVGHVLPHLEARGAQACIGTGRCQTPVRGWLCAADGQSERALVLHGFPAAIHRSARSALAADRDPGADDGCDRTRGAARLCGARRPVSR